MLTYLVCGLIAQSAISFERVFIRKLVPADELKSWTVGEIFALILMLLLGVLLWPIQLVGEVYCIYKGM